MTITHSAEMATATCALKERLQGDALSAEEVTMYEDIKKLVIQLPDSKGPKRKTDKAKKGEAHVKDEAKKPAEDDPAAARKALLKKSIKEGGKRGVEIEGAADMGGLQFF